MKASGPLVLKNEAERTGGSGRQERKNESETRGRNRERYIVFFGKERERTIKRKTFVITNYYSGDAP